MLSRGTMTSRMKRTKSGSMVVSKMRRTLIKSMIKSKDEEDVD